METLVLDLNPAIPRPAGATGTGSPILNYFHEPAAAARYAAHRPRGQARVLALIAETLQAVLPVERALDIGCGTGHSTVALLPYARQIVGIDPSSMMLAQTGSHPRIVYLKGHAEALPLQRDSFDLVTVSSAYHWFDHHAFLQEAARVLHPGGWLVLYKAGSLGLATGQPDFARWRREELRTRYPKVARNHEVLTPDVGAQFGFSEVRVEATTFQQLHRLDDYVENLLTHSSVIRMVDGGRETPEVARAWFREALAPFFPAGEAPFTHEVKIHVLRRMPVPSAACPSGRDAGSDPTGSYRDSRLGYRYGFEGAAEVERILRGGQGREAVIFRRDDAACGQLGCQALGGFASYGRIASRHNAMAHSLRRFSGSPTACE